MSNKKIGFVLLVIGVLLLFSVSGIIGGNFISDSFDGKQITCNTVYDAGLFGTTASLNSVICEKTDECITPASTFSISSFLGITQKMKLRMYVGQSEVDSVNVEVNSFGIDKQAQLSACVKETVNDITVKLIGDNGGVIDQKTVTLI